MHLLLFALAALAQDKVITVDRDNVEITESCTVKIPLNTVLPDKDGNGVVHITGSDITVNFTGLELRGAKTTMTPDEYAGWGIRITGKNVTVRNARVLGYKVGIYATAADGLVIEDSDVSHNYCQRLRSTPEAEDGSDWLWPHRNDDNEWLKNYGAGIYVEESRNVTIRRNRSRAGQNGLCMRKVEQSQIYDNDFSFMSGWGIAMFRCVRNVVTRNNCDFCVRGYSHEVYARGQDSAGFLVFEQNNDNVFAYNSATHGGDGFFGFCGLEALEGDVKAKGIGNNRNLLYRNDFSYAPAIGIEMTFSFENQFVENQLNGGNYGIWGGYSSDTLVLGNTIEDNKLAGIAIEHGSNWNIIGNEFRRNARGIELWWDQDDDLLSKPWAKYNNTKSTNYRISGNTFEGDRVGVELRGGTTEILLTGNTFTDVEPRFKVDAESRYEQREGSVERRPFEDPRLESLPGERQAIGLRKHLAGREHIIITEWGPYDWESPYIHFIGEQDGAHVYRVLGKQKLASAAVNWPAEVRVDNSGREQRLIVSPAEPGGLASYELTAKVGDHSFTRSGVLLSAEWTVRSFAYQTDPREDVEKWRSESRDATEFKTGSLRLHYQMGGPSDLKDVDAGLAKAGLPADRFGTIATTTLRIPAGSYEISTTSDDGVRVWFDDDLVIDNWTWHAPAVDRATRKFDSDRTVNVKIEHFELDGFSTLSFEMRPVKS